MNALLLASIMLSAGDSEAANAAEVRNLQKDTNQLEKLSKIVAAEPNNAEAYRDRGVLIQTINQSPACYSDLKKAIALKPSLASANVYAILGFQAAKAKDYKSADHYFEQAVSLDSHDESAWSEWVESHINRKDQKGALKLIQRAEKSLGPRAMLYAQEGTAYGNLHELDKQALYFKKAADTTTNKAYKYGWLKASFIKPGQWKTQLQVMQDDLKKHPDDLDLARFIAIELRDTHQWEQADALGAELIKISPKSPSGYILRISANDRPDKKQQYLALAQAMEKNAPLQETYLELAHGYYALEQDEQAAASLEKYLAQNGTDLSALELGVLIYRRLEEFDKAIAIQTRLMELETNPKHMIARLMQREESYRNKGDLASSIKDDTRILTIDSGNRHALENRAMSYKLLKQYDKALADIDQVIKAYPTGFSNYVLKSVILSEMGKPELALSAINQAIAKKPELGALYQERAKLFDKLGKSALANADRRKANALNRSLETDLFPTSKTSRGSR